MNFSIYVNTPAAIFLAILNKKAGQKGAGRRKKEAEGPVSEASWPLGFKTQANDGRLRLFFSSLGPAYRAPRVLVID